MTVEISREQMNLLFDIAIAELLRVETNLGPRKLTDKRWLALRDLQSTLAGIDALPGRGAYEVSRK